jgi:cytidyltransferase-like protein
MSIGVIAGRFQPFHLGHLDAVQEVARICGHAVVGIVVTNVPSESQELESSSLHPAKNPFSFFERYLMIKSSLRAGADDVAILPILPFLEKRFQKFKQLNDLYLPHDRKWFLPVKGASEARIAGWYESIGEPVECIKVRHDISAREIRRRIVSDEQWESYVPKEAINLLETFEVPRRLKELHKKYGDCVFT